MDSLALDPLPIIVDAGFNGHRVGVQGLAVEALALDLATLGVSACRREESEKMQSHGNGTRW